MTQKDDAREQVKALGITAVELLEELRGKLEESLAIIDQVHALRAEGSRILGRAGIATSESPMAFDKKPLRDLSTTLRAFLGRQR